MMEGLMFSIRPSLARNNIIAIGSLKSASRVCQILSLGTTPAPSSIKVASLIMLTVGRRGFGARAHVLFTHQPGDLWFYDQGSGNTYRTSDQGATSRNAS
jgi:hypothetical protein